MSELSTEERTAFVEALKLPKIDSNLQTMKDSILKSKGTIATTQQGNTKSGSINAGNIISFTAQLTGEDKNDVLHSILLAQLAASGKTSRIDKPVEWYNEYFKILTNVGWVVQGEPFSPYKASGSTVTIEKTVIELLSAIASGQVVLIVKQVLESLKNLHESDRGFVIWDKSTHSKKNGNFQLSAATKENTSIALSAVNLHFSAKQTDTRFLWFTYSRTDVLLNYRNTVLTLNQEAYSTVRNKVKEKLGDRITAYVDNIKLP